MIVFKISSLKKKAVLLVVVVNTSLFQIGYKFIKISVSKFEV